MNKIPISPGVVVTVDFPGATAIKRRPAVVISTDIYHRTRPDVILGLLTTQISVAIQPTDYTLQDWLQAGLRRPTAFRAYLYTAPGSGVTAIGRLSAVDWKAVQQCLLRALAVI